MDRFKVSIPKLRKFLIFRGTEKAEETGVTGTARVITLLSLTISPMRITMSLIDMRSVSQEEELGLIAVSKILNMTELSQERRLSPERGVPRIKILKIGN
jgi:hypothetical protein